jgi:phytoene synthase
MRPDPQTLFQKKSRSFSLAAKLFSAETRQDIARLYQFCRHIDDLADSSVEGEPERLKELARALENEGLEPSDLIVDDFLALARDRKLPRPSAKELVVASAADCGPRKIETVDELIQFSYGVAGTVGELMRPLIGASDRRADPFAIDMGIALQLTNIARDVAEDASRERFYLPGEWVSPECIRKALNRQDQNSTQAVDTAIQRTLELAEKYYTSALAGHWFIPHRNRRAIFFALHFYRAIGLKLKSKGPGAFNDRTVLSLFEKLGVALRAYPTYRRYCSGDWAAKQAPPHEAALHRPLQEVLA